jgi:catechol 2,3-dioxygenase-like lactoylglutathione lyase family enzyme
VRGGAFSCAPTIAPNGERFLGRAAMIGHVSMMTAYFGAFILDPDGNKIEAATFPKAT